MGRDTSKRRRRTSGVGRRLDADTDPHGLLFADPELRPIVVSTPLGVVADALPEKPTQRLRLVRAADLVNLWVLAYRCRLVESEHGPVLVPDGERARLEVQFPFQHLAERAYYEVEGDTPPTTFLPDKPPDLAKKPKPEALERRDDVDADDAPTAVRAAHRSRLLFGVPAGEAIGYSTEGILAAMSRLPLLVVFGVARP